MNSEYGLLATSRYVPRMRLERSEVYAQHRWMAPGLKSLAKGQRAVANWDEDSVTMAVEALRGLPPAVVSGAVGSLTLASNSLPFAERSNAGIVAAAAGLPSTAQVRDVGASARAALSEVIAALNMPAATATTQLVVGADRRAPTPASSLEMIVGDGAAAVAVGPGAVLATRVGAHSVAFDFVDHFRESGSANDYAWEERWVREEGYLKLARQAIEACLHACGVQPYEVTHFVMPSTLPKVNEALARKLGLVPEAVADTHAASVGDIGSGQVLAVLDTVLRHARPGALVLVAAFGSGCDVLLLRRTEAPCPGQVPDAGKPETNYLKYLSFAGRIDLEWGMRAEMDNKTALTAAWRDHARTARFEGGTCRQCGTVQFPSLRVCVNPECNAQDSQEPTSLADASARVMSHTSDFLAYTPHPPFQFGHIDFDNGARVLMEFTDTDREELHPGLPVRMVYRIKELDQRRGFRRYFWKAVPARAAQP